MTGDLQKGKITAGVGGLYTVQLTCGTVIECRAKGAFRHTGMTPLVGDDVLVSRIPDEGEGKGGRREDGVMISEILPRKNELIRPAMANLDVMFVVTAAREPDPSLRFLDKLLSILEYQRIEPILVVTKADVDGDRAEKMKIKYEKSGFRVFVTDADTRSGDTSIEAFLATFDETTTAAFCGASGVGKTTLMNRLFPTLSLETGAISEKIARGKHTTRSVDLFSLAALGSYRGWLADTPGFSMLDLSRFDFFPPQELPYTFRDFVPYLGQCRFTKCTHTKEDGCAVLLAVNEKKIPRSRHTSYLEMYDVLKNKHAWDT